MLPHITAPAIFATFALFGKFGKFGTFTRVLLLSAQDQKPLSVRIRRVVGLRVVHSWGDSPWPVKMVPLPVPVTFITFSTFSTFSTFNIFNTFTPTFVGAGWERQ